MMNETTFLCGKVIKRSLPVIRGRPGIDAPRVKRLLLPQGELAQVYDKQPGIQYLAYIELIKEAVRGNHYHKRKNEFIYVITGSILLQVQDVSTGEKDSTKAGAGDLVFIPVGIAHCFKTLESGHGIEFSVESFDAADVFSHPIPF